MARITTRFAKRRPGRDRGSVLLLSACRTTNKVGIGALGVACLLALFGATSVATAQSYPGDRGPAGRNPVCVRLEASLASLDRAPGDARSEQSRQLEEAADRQSRELERAQRQAQQMECDRTGFLIFGGPPAQCAPLVAQIQRMRSDLDRLRASMRQLPPPSPERDDQRRGLMVALAQNDCGPQYRRAAAPQERDVERPRGLIETLFGGPVEPAPPVAEAAPVDPSAGSTFRTLCVRTCDGAYFPISYVTISQRFQSDAQLCRRQCPATEVALYTHRNPGEDISQAVSTDGRPYTELPNAFRFRREFDPTCSCKRADQSWADALGADTMVEQGDVVVTEENAKAIGQPRQESAKPAQSQPARQRNKPAPPRSAQAAPPLPAPR
jgi:hypothetical protein